MIGPGGFGQAPNTGVGLGLSIDSSDANEYLMSNQDCKEHKKLQRAWAAGTATKKQILQCMELDRSAENQRTSKL